MFTPSIHPVLRNNCTQAMVKVLAEELGVRAEALTKLGLGYLPVVEFKKGFNYDGHWTFPERDATGKVVGLSLRSRILGSRKKMYPGSKHGLFYPCEDYIENKPDHPIHRHYWTRVSEAGISCPVCGKPDWCLVSADDPNDPAAAICPRTPSARNLGDAGYLHVLAGSRCGDLENEIQPASPLPTSDSPIIVVEGATDTAAVLGLGLVAVGRPSNIGGISDVTALLRGLPVIVVGENDEKSDGAWPGKFGAEKTLAALGVVCSSARIIYPPANRKDIREWIAYDGLSREAFLEYAEKHGATATESKGSALADDNPSTTATAFLSRYGSGDSRTLLYCRDSWYHYGADGWSEDKDRNGVRHEIHRFMAGKMYRKVDLRSGSYKNTPIRVTAGGVKSVLDHLAALTAVADLPPVWIDGRTSPLPEHTICFKDGMLDVTAYLRGDYRIIPHTSTLFTTARLPFAYDSTADCPRWMDWLEETLGDDPAKIDLLQEWFGYNLIPDTRHEKMMLFLGPTRSGKSVALGVLYALLGTGAVATSFKAFGSEYGLRELIGKLAAVMPDARLPDQNRMQALQSLLEIVGNDPVNINRKFKDAVSLHLRTRITIASNLMPNLPDEALALRHRMMVISFHQSFSQNPEIGLKNRLKENEMGGIALWALEGLRRLTDRGQFTILDDADQMMEDFQMLVSPVAEFAETWLRINTEIAIDIETLFAAWKQFTNERGVSGHSKQWLYNQLKLRFPHIRRTTAVKNGHTIKYVHGLDLHDFTINAERHRKG